jgi:hypothetical protein
LDAISNDSTKNHSFGFDTFLIEKQEITQTTEERMIKVAYPIIRSTMRRYCQQVFNQYIPEKRKHRNQFGIQLGFVQ